MFYKAFRKFLLSSCHAVNEITRPSPQVHVQHSHKCHIFGHKVGICCSFLPRVKNVSRLHCWVSSWVSCDTIKYLSKRLDSKQQYAVSGSFTWEVESDTEKTEMGITFHMCFLWSFLSYLGYLGEKKTQDVFFFLKAGLQESPCLHNYKSTSSKTLYPLSLFETGLLYIFRVPK